MPHVQSAFLVLILLYKPTINIMNNTEHHQGGSSVEHFLWIYVAIFSAIMVVVMIEEHFFLK
jgi:hypothetical protein